MPTENKMTYTVEEIQEILGICKSSAYSSCEKRRIQLCENWQYISDFQKQF